MRLELITRSNLHLVDSLMIKRGLTPVEDREIPELGVLITYKSVPIVAGFLRKVEGGFGIFDGYITNPEASSEKRNDALDLLTVELLRLAKEEHILGVFFNTHKPNIIKRAALHGFKLADEVMMYRGVTLWDS